MFTNIIFGTRQIGGMPSYNNHSEAEALDLLDYVFSKGITSFDTAPIYGNGNSEKILGKFIKNNNEKDFNFRSKIKIITKFGFILKENGENEFSFTKESIIKQLEDSLKRLNTDYIDVYLLHIPNNSVDVGVIIETLNYLKNTGKIKSYGLCNTYEKQLADFLNNEDNQIEYIEDFYNLIEKKAENLIFPYIQNKDIKFLAYSPLYRGVLTDIGFEKLLKKDEAAINRLIKHDGIKDLIKKRKIFLEIAKLKNISISHLAIDFLYKNKNVDGILFGTKSKKHLDEFLENYSKL